MGMNKIVHYQPSGTGTFLVLEGMLATTEVPALRPLQETRDIHPNMCGTFNTNANLSYRRREV